jgi:hypothetical protein
VILDYVTGLMWSGDESEVLFSRAAREVAESRYAGYDDWRIPTFEEAMSLTPFYATYGEPRDRYPLNLVRSCEQGILTADKDERGESYICRFETPHNDFLYGFRGAAHSRFDLQNWLHVRMVRTNGRRS